METDLPDPECYADYGEFPLCSCPWCSCIEHVDNDGDWCQDCNDGSHAGYCRHEEIGGEA